ncbi:MAG: hypothetical protein IPK44_24265 [Candidatus Accumulibacter sp.]|nr:hypothetical protein [Accumulibacter sp.]
MSAAAVHRRRRGARVQHRQPDRHRGARRGGAKLSAAYQAYAGRINAAELALRATQADATLTLDADKTNQGKDLQEVETYNKAFLSEAQLVAQQLVSMFDNLRAGSSATLSVSASHLRNIVVK